MKRFKIYLLCTLLIAGITLASPAASVTTQAASTKFRIASSGKKIKGKKRKNYAYVNNTKIPVSATPTFLYNGSYYGDVKTLLSGSALKVTATSNSKKLTLKYNGNVLVMTTGKKTAYLNGKKTVLGTYPLRGRFLVSGKMRWIVPLKSICTRLGINYLAKSNVIYINGAVNPDIAAAENTTAATTEATIPPASSIPKAKRGNCPVITLVLDPGHGGADSGAINKSLGLAEKNLNLAIVLAAKNYFDKDPNFKVYYTRTADTYPSLSDRYKLANNMKADLFISIHINSVDYSSATGTETWYNSSRTSKVKNGNLNNYGLAAAMQKSTVETTGFVNRGLKTSKDLQVLKYTNMPACLIEYGFISNNKEATLMKNNTARYGKALYDGLVAYMKLLERY